MMMVMVIIMMMMVMVMNDIPLLCHLMLLNAYDNDNDVDDEKHYGSTPVISF